MIVLIHVANSQADAEFLAEQISSWAPSEEDLQLEISAFKGSWLDARIASASDAFIIQVGGLLFFG